MLDKTHSQLVSWGVSIRMPKLNQIDALLSRCHLQNSSFCWEPKNEAHTCGCNNIVFVGWQLYVFKSNIETLD